MWQVTPTLMCLWEAETPSLPVHCSLGHSLTVLVVNVLPGTNL